MVLIDFARSGARFLRDERVWSREAKNVEGRNAVKGGDIDAAVLVR